MPKWLHGVVKQEVRRKTCSALRFHDSFDSSMPDPDGESDLDMTSFYELVDENGKNVFKCFQMFDMLKTSIVKTTNRRSTRVNPWERYL